MTTINLKIKDEQGNVQNKQHEVEALNGFQFEAVMKVVNSIMKEMQQDQSLKGLFSSVFGEEDIKEVDLAKLNTDLLLNAVNSFETLFVKMPSRAYELLSALSDVDVHTLKSQKFEDTLNIYDAILMENDVERLVNRIKKSLALTQGKMKFLNLVKKATGQPVTQA
ncbi:hypothetical protein BKM15_25960 [Pseudomonas syringae pv. syringae]|nr:hypothetical protein BKM15_25960 [Pseudomonas syringae pv. syringae]